MDYEGIKTLLLRANERFPRLRHLWLDAGYRGEDNGADWVQKALGWTVDLVERPKKPAPQKVMMAWALGSGPKRAWRWIGASSHAPRRLRGAPEEVGRRTHDRLDRPQQEDEPMDYERSCASGEALVYAAMIRLMMRRLARV